MVIMVQVEIGHIRTDFDQRFNCNCGKSGCIETVASATGVVNLVNFIILNLLLNHLFYHL